MDEREARQHCDQLQAEHPDRTTHTWVPVPAGDGKWKVAKLSVPPAAPPSGTGAHTEAKRPDDDNRDIPPWLDTRPRGF